MFESQPSYPSHRKIVAGALSWRAHEHEHVPKSPRWYLTVSAFLVAIVAYAIFTSSPIMAITFILIGIVGYLLINRESPELEFRVTDKGIEAGKEFYPYENMKTFWIFYDPPEQKYISLHMNAELVPYIHIPLGDIDPVQVRETLLQYLPEYKHPVRFIDILEKIF